MRHLVSVFTLLVIPFSLLLAESPKKISQNTKGYLIMKRVLSILVIVLFSVSAVAAESFMPGVRIQKEQIYEVRGVPAYNYYQKGRKINAVQLMNELKKYQVSHKNAELAHKHRNRKYRWCLLMLLFPLGTLYVVLGPHRELDSQFWKYLDKAVNDYNRSPRSRKIIKE
ncbi:MAG TPA: hypothetical protein ENN21_07340 [Spirochaetes bacterium]|nr:hypothetical protein [Spirochaetota bacterium]